MTYEKAHYGYLYKNVLKSKLVWNKLKLINYYAIYQDFERSKTLIIWQNFFAVSCSESLEIAVQQVTSIVRVRIKIYDQRMHHAIEYE